MHRTVIYNNLKLTVNYDINIIYILSYLCFRLKCFDDNTKQLLSRIHENYFAKRIYYIRLKCLVYLSCDRVLLS